MKKDQQNSSQAELEEERYVRNTVEAGPGRIRRTCGGGGGGGGKMTKEDDDDGTEEPVTEREGKRENDALTFSRKENPGEVTSVICWAWLGEEERMIIFLEALRKGKSKKNFLSFILTTPIWLASHAGLLEYMLVFSGDLSEGIKPEKLGKTSREMS